MGDLKREYERLIHGFLCGDLSAKEFQIEYINKFKTEKRILRGDLYEVLEEVFGCADSFTTDVNLLSENPNFYLTELQLREKMGTVADRLRSI